MSQHSNLSERKPDFQRNTWCFLGIPVDLISFDDTVKTIRHCMTTGRTCFLSTPNLNFIVACQQDVEFRDSLIDSDLVVLDGMPPVWLAKLMGLPGIEKVSGSNFYLLSSVENSR